MSDKNKFKNISAINANISRLYKSIGAPLVPNFNTNLVIDNGYYHSDIFVSTQNIAKQIADCLGLDITKVVVTFVHNLGVPGKVELSAGNTFFIEVDERYKSNTNFISAILAHEVAHIYLFKHKICIKDTFQNEVLTDTTAAFLGCAWLLLNSSYEEASELHMTLNSFGYISQFEVGYILAKRDFLLQQNSSDAMIYGHSREFFDVGKSYFLKSLRRPYVKRSALGNLDYQIKSTLKAGSIIFRCICCDQLLKIPENNKTLSVRCPSCCNNLLCYS
jgi:hypothetical protein